MFYKCLVLISNGVVTTTGRRWYWKYSLCAKYKITSSKVPFPFPWSAASWLLLGMEYRTTGPCPWCLVDTCSSYSTVLLWLRSISALSLWVLSFRSRPPSVLRSTWRVLHGPKHEWCICIWSVNHCIPCTAGNHSCIPNAAWQPTSLVHPCGDALMIPFICSNPRLALDTVVPPSCGISLYLTRFIFGHKSFWLVLSPVGKQDYGWRTTLCFSVDLHAPQLNVPPTPNLPSLWKGKILTVVLRFMRGACFSPCSSAWPKTHVLQLCCVDGL